jgi:hypothetical protein
MISFRRPVLLLLSLAATALAGQDPKTFPFEPAQLLTVLPAAPENWKVTRSVADTSLGEWLETRATRTFQPPPSPETTPATPAGEVEVSVTDTAGFGPSLVAFADFAPGKSGALEKKLLGSLPAMVITSEGGRQITQVLVSARYLVEITTTNPQLRVEDWLRTLHFDLLPPAAATPTTRPREFRLTHVDELKPAQNRSYLVSAPRGGRGHDFLKALPESPAEAGNAGQSASERTNRN